MQNLSTLSPPVVAAAVQLAPPTRDPTEMYLGVAASAMSLMSLLVSGLHCACRRRAEAFDWDIRFQRTRDMSRDLKRKQEQQRRPPGEDETDEDDAERAKAPPRQVPCCHNHHGPQASEPAETAAPAAINPALAAPMPMVRTGESCLK
jgi:hypothetical protein